MKVNVVRGPEHKDRVTEQLRKLGRRKPKSAEAKTGTEGGKKR